MSEEKKLDINQEDLKALIADKLNSVNKVLSEGITKAFDEIEKVKNEVKTLQVELEEVKKQNAKQDTSLTSIYSDKSS